MVHAHLLYRSPLIERARRGRLDDGPVRKRVRVGDTKLNDVGPNGVELDECLLGGLEVGIAGNEERNERDPAGCGSEDT